MKTKLGGQTDGINKKEKTTDVNKYIVNMSNIRANNWDIDCDTNLLNDITEDYGFHEDRGTIKNKI